MWARTLVACSTTTGRQPLYGGRDLFDRFREMSHEIADHRSCVEREEDRYPSTWIRRRYRNRTARRTHAQVALARDPMGHLHVEGVRRCTLPLSKASSTTTGRYG